jgi:GTPase SAR1 family protein
MVNLKNWIKSLFNDSPKDAEKPKETENKPINGNGVRINDMDVFATPEGLGRWVLVIGHEGFGKTTLVKEFVSKRFEKWGYIQAEDFQPQKDLDLLIIDDLHKCSKAKLDEIFAWLCNARHDNIKNVIAITQDLKNIDSATLRRFVVYVFFWNQKQAMKLQAIVRGGLKESLKFANMILDIPRYHYILYDAETGFIKNPPVSNRDVDILIQALNKPIPKTRTQTVKEKIPNGDGIKTTYVIASLVAMNPHIKYSKIAEAFNKDVNYVKQCVYRLKNGKIDLTQEQIERIASQYQKLIA